MAATDHQATPASAAGHRRDPPGGSARPARASIICSPRRRSNPISIRRAQAQTSSAQRAVPVHRPDLARHDEASRARRSATATMPTRSAQDATGAIEVADPACAARDPAACATTRPRTPLMAGAFTRTNAAQLAARLGRQPTEGELYIAHFLGADGAGKLDQPRSAISRKRAAATLFPAAASANRSIFLRRRPAAQRWREVLWPDRLALSGRRSRHWPCRPLPTTATASRRRTPPA